MPDTTRRGDVKDEKIVSTISKIGFNDFDVLYVEVDKGTLIVEVIFVRAKNVFIHVLHFFPIGWVLLKGPSAMFRSTLPPNRTIDRVNPSP
ncbi:MAG: hypothetical protein WB615_09255 [Candidatus Tumulicola sp.]